MGAGEVVPTICSGRPRDRFTCQGPSNENGHGFGRILLLYRNCYRLVTWFDNRCNNVHGKVTQVLRAKPAWLSQKTLLFISM